MAVYHRSWLRIVCRMGLIALLVGSTLCVSSTLWAQAGGVVPNRLLRLSVVRLRRG